MRHVISTGLICIVATLLAIVLYFITGVYGRITFPFILFSLLSSYVVYQIDIKRGLK